ncbi:MAG: VWA domain-containing protein [Acidobacteria bacterium]|nr:VWA domain-containing protein [Acidobacteriota bacterium]MBI3662549.1 VWA domain-containing protein [Acidobacteriota bacterium]
MKRPAYAAASLALALIAFVPGQIGGRSFRSDISASGREWALAPEAALQVSQRPVPPQQEPRIKAQVNLVSVIASVLDKDGRPVPDLPKEAFEVFEEGVKQQVEVFEPETQQPLDLALMIDSSLSTLKELSFERDAAARFIRQVVRPHDRLAVFEISDVVTQLAEFSSDVPRLAETVRRIEGGGGAPLYDAIVLGSQALEKRPPGRRRVLVFVTDAGETTSRAKFDDARRAALAAGAMLYTILINPVKSEGGRNTAGEHALLTITEVTGGSIYYPQDAAALNAIFDRMDRELRTQYRLGYYPVPRPPSRSFGTEPLFRRIEVKVKTGPAPGATAPSVASSDSFVVRHRKGYFTPGEM